MLRAGQGKLRGQAIVSHAADGHRLPYRDGVFDGAFSAFCVRNLADLPRGLGELRRVVRPGGRVVILEFSAPGAPAAVLRPHLQRPRAARWSAGR